MDQFKIPQVFHTGIKIKVSLKMSIFLCFSKKILQTSFLRKFYCKPFVIEYLAYLFMQCS